MSGPAPGAGGAVLRRPPRPLLLAAATTTVAVAPVFLVSALVVQIGRDLHLSPGSLGLAVSAFFAVTALSSARLGRVVQRWGARRALSTAIVGSSLALVGLALSQSTVQVAACLAVAGLANGAVHPASNALLATGASRDRLGLALGVKQAAPTAATFMAGLAVPVVALTLGWRWSFVGALAAAVLLLRAVLRIDEQSLRPEGPRKPPRPIKGACPLVVVAVAGGLGSAAGNSFAVFFVDYAVRAADMAEGSTGLLYAVVSLAGLAGRIGCGWIVDRPRAPGPFALTIGMLLLGSFGHALVSLPTPLSLVVGAVLAYAAGWAWPGLLHFAGVAPNPGGAAGATGVLMTGFATGAFAGPLLLGQVAQAVGYPGLWLCSTALNLIAGAILLAGVRRGRRRG